MQDDRAIISCGVLAAIWIAIGIPSNYALYPLWAQCLTYHFFHANLFHLLANGFCLFQMIRTKRAGWGRLAIAFAIASLIPLIYNGQIIGFSNILYALTGLSFLTFKKQTRCHKCSQKTQKIQRRICKNQRRCRSLWWKQMLYRIG